MDVTQTPNVARSVDSAAAQNQKAEISSDFETFLKMLTVQMQNQDPLNPVDSADYAVQLATFSGVEQQVKTNDLLQSLTALWGGNELSRLGEWVGQEVRAVSPAYFDGNPITLSLDTSVQAGRIQVEVKDASGQLVRQFDAAAGTSQIDWDGRDNTGAVVQQGNYTFEQAHFVKGEETSRQQIATYSRVVEVRKDAGKFVLILEGGTAVPAETVSALREPRSGT